MRLGLYFVGILACLQLGGCTARAADCARLTDELARLRSEVASGQVDRRKVEARLGHRVARLEAELAVVKRQVPPRAHAGDVRPSAGDPSSSAGDVRHRANVGGPRGSARPGNGPPPRVSCPAALPPAVRKVRHRMRFGKLRQLLAGVKIRRSKALTLSGSGSRTRRVWTGPCFRITIEADRVATVELDGVKSKQRRRRRRRR